MSASPEEVATLGRVHIVGIGGAGMSGIARVLMSQGIAVTGSDAKDSRRIAALRALGAEIWVGHDPAHVAGADTVVFSTAIPDSNPELRMARTHKLKIMTRALALAEITRGYRGVAVAGTHGKTTTTSMLTVALQHGGEDPSFVIGSELNETGSNAHLGTGEIFVVEADESDATFLQLEPVAGIVTNIEPDHTDYWGSAEAIERAFAEFADGICERGGFVVACADDAGSARLVEASRRHAFDIRTYGESSDADYRIEVVDKAADGWAFDVVHHGVRSEPIRLRVPGRHNVLNAGAALACGLGLGLSPHVLSEGLEMFTGTRRRFEFRGEADGVRVFDDYAHHPTAVKATLEAAQHVKGSGRVVVAFQPYRYYRTAMFIREYGDALALADDVVVLEVFGPGEEPIPGASGQVIAANIPLDPDRVVFEPSWSRAASEVVGRTQPGDVVMTLGPSEIGMLCPEILEGLRLRARSRGRDGVETPIVG